jgi:hypothetical protein
MGLSAGAAFQQVATQYAPQIAASFRPLLPPTWLGVAVRGDSPNLTWQQLVNNWVVLAILVSVMAYFFFSFEHRSAVMRKTANLGRWMLMISFGAIFGQTVMARMALAVSRLWFLLVDQRGLAGPGG